MGGDGHNVGQPVLSVAFRFGSIRGYIDNGDVGGGGCVKRSSVSTQGTVNEDRGMM